MSPTLSLTIIQISTGCLAPTFNTQQSYQSKVVDWGCHRTPEELWEDAFYWLYSTIILDIPSSHSPVIQWLTAYRDFEIGKQRSSGADLAPSASVVPTFKFLGTFISLSRAKHVFWQTLQTAETKNKQNTSTTVTLKTHPGTLITTKTNILITEKNPLWNTSSVILLRLAWLHLTSLPYSINSRPFILEMSPKEQ